MALVLNHPELVDEFWEELSALNLLIINLVFT